MTRSRVTSFARTLQPFLRWEPILPLGVVWVQGAIQDGCYPLPFGGQSCLDFGVEDPIVDICSPMVLGVPNPIEGDAASHVTDTDSNVFAVYQSHKNS